MSETRPSVYPSPVANIEITLLTSTGSAISLAKHCPPTTGSASLAPASSLELLPPGGVVDDTFDLGCKATFSPGTYSLSIVSYVHDGKYSPTPIATLQSNTLTFTIQ